MVKKDDPNPINAGEWIVPAETPAGTRLDRFLQERMPGLSRSALRDLFAQGRVRVNRRVTPKGAVPQIGDRVGVALPESNGPPPDRALDFSLLHADDDLLVVDKPGGMATQALRPWERGTLADALASRFPELREAGPNPLEAGLVHRLDNETSGLLVAGRTRKSWTRLHQDLTQGRWEKHYLALVHGTLDSPRTLTDPLVHHGRDRRRMIRIGETGIPFRGRLQPAETRVRPRLCGTRHTLVAAELITGVRHQIRVHLAGIGHPLVGDRLYGPVPGESLATRHLLHAHQIRLLHPRTGETMTFSSPLPDDFKAVLKELIYH